MVLGWENLARVSLRIASVGLCILPWMVAPAQADILDQFRMASTGPFTFTIKPASSLPASPQEPVNREPLKAKPPAPPEAAAAPNDESAAAKAKRQHDEDAANAGLHVEPQEEEATEAPAAESAAGQTARPAADPAPANTARGYTPVPAGLNAWLESVTRTKNPPPTIAEPAQDTAAPDIATAPIPAPQEAAFPPLPPPQEAAEEPAAPPPYVVAAPSYYPPQLVVVQANPYPAPQYAPAPMLVYPPVAIYQAMPAYRFAPGWYRPVGFGTAYNRPVMRGWFGGYR